VSPNPLIGKTIVGIDLTTDRVAIRFRLASGEQVVATCDAYCCSSTWIEHVSLPERGCPATVIDVSEISMPDLGQMPGRDVVQYYGFQVRTDKGDLTIDYRNESNGYYGGSLSWPGEDHYGGVYGQNVAGTDWREVTNDE
jgi:hypothetical protein